MRRREQGDTIIEVVVAFAIFSAVALATMMIINNGVAITQRNLEITLVREQVDAQAELLRYIKETNNPIWQTLISPGRLTASPVSLSDSCRDALSSGGYYVKPAISSNLTTTPTTFTLSNSFAKPATYAKIDYSTGATQSKGIWIQGTRAQQKSGAPAAYDFYIHACWDSVGVSVPMTAGTIVRIYE